MEKFAQVSLYPLLVVGSVALGLAVAGSSAEVGAPGKGHRTHQKSSSLRLAGPLEEALKAHGGVDTWRQYRKITFHLREWPLGKQAPLNDRHVADLKNRHQYVEGESYSAGYNGTVAWATPSIDSVGLPPIFYTMGSFYFQAMPFVWADPGVNARLIGTRTYERKRYDAVRITYDEGVGVSDEDDYVAFFHPETHELRLIHFVPTYVGFRGNTPIEEVTRRALVFEQHQRVGGLLLPARATFYVWKNGTTQGEGATYRIEDVSLSKEPTEAELFDPPENAEIDQSGYRAEFEK